MRKLLIFHFILLFSLNLYSQEIIYLGEGFSAEWFEDTTAYKYFKLDTIDFWQLGEPYKETLGYTGGNNALFTDTTMHYKSNIYASSQIKVVLPESYSGMVVHLIHRYDFEPNKDGGIIEISFDNGENWNNILFDTIMQNSLVSYSNIYDNDDTISSYENNPGYTGLSNSGISSILDFYLPKYPVMDTVMFRFICSTDENNANNEGWIIDELGIWKYKVSVKEIDNTKSKFRIYANLTDNCFTINSENPIKNFKVISLQGKTEFKKTGSDIKTVYLNDLDPGFYIISCSDKNDQTYTSKILVK